jgi:hydrogenase maturation protein HypF
MTDDGIAAKRIQVNGIVQGVGFRPFIFQLAMTHGLKGNVANTESGVLIHVEGPDQNIRAFQESIRTKAPPLAQVIELQSETLPPAGYTEFKIIQSSGSGNRYTLISPDVAVCDDCLREMKDPQDRRFGYPFINCTHCGPRYTIIEDIPYDRYQTSMRPFNLCAACRREYEDPLDRRFHAQPNACPDCGPEVTLWDTEGRVVPSDDPIRMAVDLIQNGKILAVKGLGGFHLAVNGLDETAVVRLRQRKRREEKPLALMCPDLETIRALAHITHDEERLLRSQQRPIVLLTRLQASAVASSVSPQNRYLGVMLPYTPLHHLLLSHGLKALVMTSANLAEEPICIDNREALRRLGGIADYYLVHNRDIYLRTDDTVLRHAAGGTRFVRRSRGYVPVPIFLKTPVPSILAVGAELKNTNCLTRGKQAFLSQHIGDLENLETLEFFKKTISHLKRILDISPKAVAHDLHPDYLSTRFALSQSDVPTIGIQHHHAHIVSCMAEHGLDGPVIGLSLDGTGYGLDGTIWGGEVLISELGGFTRAAHLSYSAMPGGAAAIRQPWRMALSYAYEVVGHGFLDMKFAFLKDKTNGEVSTLCRMIDGRLNSPFTSSMGRLFDGVAALIGLREKVAFEGQAAMMLEMAAPDVLPNKTYDYFWTGDEPKKISIPSIIKGVIKDLNDGVQQSTISGRFHATLIRLFTDLCKALKMETGLDRVVLSGGVFQNALLLTGLVDSLTQEGFTVYSHEKVPTNDGGIALGQAVAAAALFQGKNSIDEVISI